MNTNGLTCHDLLVEKASPKLSFDENKSYELWKREIKEKFIELLGLDEIALNSCEPNLVIDSEEKKDGYKQIHFTFRRWCIKRKHC